MRRTGWNLFESMRVKWGCSYADHWRASCPMQHTCISVHLLEAHCFICSWYSCQTTSIKKMWQFTLDKLPKAGGHTPPKYQINSDPLIIKQRKNKHTNQWLLGLHHIVYFSRLCRQISWHLWISGKAEWKKKKKEFLRRSDSKQFRKTINNVCCLYKL